MLQLKQVKKGTGPETRISTPQAAKDKAQRTYQTEKRRQKDALLRSMRRSVEREQAIDDNQNQLNDLLVGTARQVDCVRVLPERVQVYEALFTLPRSTVREERDRETRAIAALVALYAKKEDRRHFQMSIEKPMSGGDNRKEDRPDSDKHVKAGPHTQSERNLL